jgi:hypothetical protein
MSESKTYNPTWFPSIQQRATEQLRDRQNAGLATEKMRAAAYPTTEAREPAAAGEPAASGPVHQVPREDPAFSARLNPSNVAANWATGAGPLGSAAPQAGVADDSDDAAKSYPAGWLPKRSVR